MTSQFIDTTVLGSLPIYSEDPANPAEGAQWIVSTAVVLPTSITASIAGIVDNSDTLAISAEVTATESAMFGPGPGDCKIDFFEGPVEQTIVKNVKATTAVVKQDGYALFYAEFTTDTGRNYFTTTSGGHVYQIVIDMLGAESSTCTTEHGTASGVKIHCEAGVCKWSDLKTAFEQMVSGHGGDLTASVTLGDGYSNTLVDLAATSTLVMITNNTVGKTHLTQFWTGPNSSFNPNDSTWESVVGTLNTWATSNLEAAASIATLSDPTYDNPKFVKDAEMVPTWTDNGEVATLEQHTMISGDVWKTAFSKA